MNPIFNWKSPIEFWKLEDVVEIDYKNVLVVLTAVYVACTKPPVDLLPKIVGNNDAVVLVVVKLFNGVE